MLPVSQDAGNILKKGVDQMQYTKPELLVAGTALSLIQQVNGAKAAVPGDNISAGHSCYVNELDE